MFTGVRCHKSFVIHGPHHSGKTTFLLALRDILQKDACITGGFFEMSAVYGMVRTHGEYNGFYRFLSSRIFGEVLDEERLTRRLEQLTQPICLLVDEIQYIFTSQLLLSIAMAFF